MSISQEQLSYEATKGIICDMHPMDIPIPEGMRFFHPNEEFWNLIIQASDRYVVDLGCGNGDLVRELNERGCSAVGVDIRATPGPNIYCMNACHFPFSDKMTVLVCRPDPSGWCTVAIEMALEAGARVIYIGKESNIERDLDTYPLADRYQYAGIHDRPVGEEGEVAVVF